MGRTLIKLANKRLLSSAVFPQRFVIEICEKVHTHYRNLRITQSLTDWIQMAEGYKDALERWKKRGCPTPRKESHIELCRKIMRGEAEDEKLEVNLNKNLYLDNKDKIFAEGAEIEDLRYIHFKIRDLRIEMSISEFKEICALMKDAEAKLEDCNIGSNV